jgi:hypothetical protein
MSLIAFETPVLAFSMIARVGVLAMDSVEHTALPVTLELAAELTRRLPMYLLKSLVGARTIGHSARPN